MRTFKKEKKLHYGIKVVKAISLITDCLLREVINFYQKQNNHNLIIAFWAKPD